MEPDVLRKLVENRTILDRLGSIIGNVIGDISQIKTRLQMQPGPDVNDIKRHLDRVPILLGDAINQIEIIKNDLEILKTKDLPKIQSAIQSLRTELETLKGNQASPPDLKVQLEAHMQEMLEAFRDEFMDFIEEALKEPGVNTNPIHPHKV